MVRLSRLRPRTPQHCMAVTEAFLFLGVYDCDGSELWCNASLPPHE